MTFLNYTEISHQDLVYANPMSVDKMEQLIMRLQLPKGAAVLDVGTGSGEFAIRLVEQYQADVIGIDLSENLLAKARKQAALRIHAGKLTLLQQDAMHYAGAADSFQLVSCIGSTHALGDYTNALVRLATLVCSGGYIVVGELYWRQKPSPAYLAAFGVAKTAYGTHADNVALGIRQGLVPLYAVVASEDEFDAYEWQGIWAIEAYARQNPADPNLPALLQRKRDWRDMYLRWGRATLGFGVYVFQRP